MRVNILGTYYTIKYKELGAEGIDGYCDYTSKEIMIRSDNENGVNDFRRLQKKQLRHEVIHAYLSESGLQSNFEHANQWGHEETMIDWIAIQFPKILKTFEKIGCLDLVEDKIGGK